MNVASGGFRQDDEKVELRMGTATAADGHWHCKYVATAGSLHINCTRFNERMEAVCHNNTYPGACIGWPTTGRKRANVLVTYCFHGLYFVHKSRQRREKRSIDEDSVLKLKN